jgi:hypothetical protein
MVPTVTTTLPRFTGEWATLLQPETIPAVCHEIGYTAWRDRRLTPVTTIHLCLLQMLHGHTACSHLPHLSGLRFSAAASCQARARLPWRVFDLRLERFSRAVQRSALDDGRWYGHCTFLVDGSGGSMPDTPALQKAFGQSIAQRPGCGFPMAPLLGLCHAGTGILHRPPRLLNPPDHPGDHAPRRGTRPGGCPHCAVPPALAGRDLVGAPQDHAADGGVARSNRTGGAEGADRLGHGRQPGPDGYVALRHTPTHRRGAAQFPRCAAVARRAMHRDPVRSLNRESCTPPSGGAARQEAAP